MPNNRLGLLALYGSIVLLALNGLFAKLIPLDALSITQLRSVVAGFGLLGFCLLQRRRWALKNNRQIIGVYFLGFLLGLHWATLFHAMQVSTVALGMVTFFCYPVITILIEPFLTKGNGQSRYPKRGDIGAGIFVIVGIMVMVWDELHLSIESNLIEGCIWGVISALLFSVRNLAVRYRFHDVPSDRLILHQVVSISLIFAVFVDYPRLLTFTIGDWGLLVALGLVATAVAHTLLAISLKKLTVKTVAIISCSQPVMAALLAWLVMAEEPSWSVTIGGGIILLTAIAETLKKSRPKFFRQNI